MEIEELQGWSVYLNTVFSRQVQDDIRMGWLVHVIRCMMSKKGSNPQFKDSIPPIQTMMRDFISKKEPVSVDKTANLGIQIARVREEEKVKERLWKEGKLMVDGLYKGEIPDRPPERSGKFVQMG